MRCDPREGEEEEGRVRVQKNLIVAMNELRRRYVNYWNWVVSAAPRPLSASLFSVCLSVCLYFSVCGRDKCSWTSAPQKTAIALPPNLKPPKTNHNNPTPNIKKFTRNRGGKMSATIFFWVREEQVSGGGDVAGKCPDTCVCMCWMATRTDH